MPEVPRKRSRPAGGMGLPPGLAPEVRQAFEQLYDVLSRHEARLTEIAGPQTHTARTIDVGAARLDYIAATNELVVYAHRLVFRDGRFEQDMAPYVIQRWQLTHAQGGGNSTTIEVTGDYYNITGVYVQVWGYTV